MAQVCHVFVGQVLGARLLEEPPRLPSLPHLCTVRGGPSAVPAAGGRRPAAGAVPGSVPGPQLPVQPRPGPA